VIYIIVNGKKLTPKKRKKIEIAENVFRAAGLDYQINVTERKGHAKELAEKFTSSGEKCTVVAMGGDGTLHETLNGFSDFENCNLGLIPFGTGNDFAAAANVPTDVKRAAETIAYLSPRPIDFIELECGLRSINTLGMGIDVDVLKRAYSGVKDTASKYAKALMVSIMKFKSYNFTAEYDGRSEKHYGLIAELCNGRQFGGGMKVAPDAKIDDGYMELVITDYLTKPKLITAFLKIMTGKIKKIKETSFARVSEAEFICESQSFTIQADGELYDNLPVKAHIVSGKLKFHIPY